MPHNCHKKHCCHAEHWHGSIKECGRRMTLPRSIILQFMENSTGHLSAEEVFTKLKQTEPSIGIATVYRNLELLTKLGIVNKFDFGDGKARYEFAQNKEGQNHHHHLVCINCKRIIDYKDFAEEEIELLKKTEQTLSKKYNFEIKNHLIRFYGLCDKCK